MGLKFEACDVLTTMRHGGNPLAVTDPFAVNVTAIGALPAERLGGAQCVGPIAHAPDLRLNYRAGQGLPLYLSAVPGADVTLVVNLPDGRWACHDDRQGTNPGLLFPHPRSGP